MNLGGRATAFPLGKTVRDAFVMAYPFLLMILQWNVPSSSSSACLMFSSQWPSPLENLKKSDNSISRPSRYQTTLGIGQATNSTKNLTGSPSFTV